MFKQSLGLDEVETSFDHLGVGSAVNVQAPVEVIVSFGVFTFFVELYHSRHQSWVFFVVICLDFIYLVFNKDWKWDLFEIRFYCLCHYFI